MKSNKKREESESRFMTACQQLYEPELYCTYQGTYLRRYWSFMSRCCIEEMLEVSKILIQVYVATNVLTVESRQVHT